MMSKQICVIGNFNGDYNSFDGQTIKTKNIYKELEKKYGLNNIDKVDTFYFKKRPLFFFLNFFAKQKESKNIIILPAHNSIKILLPLLVMLKKREQKIHYILIGGWLPSYLNQHRYLLKYVKKVDFIYPETLIVKKLLKDQNINNTYILKNFKDLKKYDKKWEENCDVFRFCIFSRIEEKKGINEAIQVIEKINCNYNNICFLDIYGKINDSYETEFKMKIKNSSNIRYCGVKNPNDSVDVISKYDVLLFPTKYYTEGIPGTIIDSFFAGVPSISSKWESFSDILTDGYNCLGYEFGDIDDFYSKIEIIINNHKLLKELSINCLQEADNYLPEKSLDCLMLNIEDKKVVYNEKK